MTTDNLPAIVEDRTPATADTDSWIQVVGDVANLAAKIAGTEFVPKGLRNNVAGTAAAILYGREVGLPPMTALTQTHVIEGRPSVSAEAMRALVLAAGHELEFTEMTGAVCAMRGRRRGAESWQTLAWTLDMARAAGLLGKDNWKKYPRAMLAARCTADLCRMVFPDVIHGFRAVEELEDMGTEDGDTAPVEAPSGPTTKVSRKRTAKSTTSKAGLPPAEPRPEPPTLEGPPLPGEPGYDEPETSKPVGEGEESGSDDRTPSNEGDPGVVSEDPDSEPIPAEEPVDAEIVEEPSDTTEEPRPSPRPLTRAQHRMMMGLFGRLEIEDRVERLHVTSVIVGRTLETSNDLSHDECSTLIDTLGRVKTYEKLAELLDAIEHERAETP